MSYSFSSVLLLSNISNKEYPFRRYRHVPSQVPRRCPCKLGWSLFDTFFAKLGRGNDDQVFFSCSRGLFQLVRWVLSCRVGFCYCFHCRFEPFLFVGLIFLTLKDHPPSTNYKCHRLTRYPSSATLPIA
jgi:hypothetical protein